MVTLAESTNAITQGNSDLNALQVLSLDQQIPFTQYVRYVLPLDGYVFWLKTQSTIIQGSLHVTIDKRQLEDESISINRVVLSTGELIQEFNEISPTKIWVGTFQNTQFAFTRADSIYEAANLFHYAGDAVYPAMASQLIDVGEQLSAATLVVSNSLPMWLALQSYTPVWLVPTNPNLTLFPSFAVPANLQPPYGVVHIDPSGITNLQATPLLGPTRPVGNAALGTITGTTPDSTHWQLTSDRVRITLYGATNQVATDFLDLVNQYSYDQNTMGIMVESAVKDEKRTQAELGILAMKKTIDFTVSYYQTRANNVARQLVKSAIVTLVPNPLYT